MKKGKIICIIVGIIILSMGCQNMPYSGDTPAYYNGTCWVSDEPIIWFENPNDNTSEYLYGKAQISKEEIDIAVYFAAFDPTIYIYVLETEELHKETVVQPELEFSAELCMESYIGNCMLSGTCEYSKEECIVTIDYDQWYNGEYEVIVFKSEAMEDKDV